MARHIWPPITASVIDDVVFRLTYCQHGGSGLNWTRQDVLDCPWDRALATIDRLNKARTRESAAIREANKPKGRAR